MKARQTVGNIIGCWGALLLAELHLLGLMMMMLPDCGTCVWVISVSVGW